MDQAQEIAAQEIAAQEIAALRARIEQLEAQNQELSGRESGDRDRSPDGSAAPPRARKGVGRGLLAAVLILVSVLLAPVAVIGGWARLELVDTDRFVQTFGPLAEDPDVQRFIAAQTEQAIFDSVDVDGLVGDLFEGIASLDMPPRTQAAVALLEGPAAAGVRSLISSSVERVVASPQFAQIWEGALRETHSRAIAVIQGDPNTALQLDDDGTLSLRLQVVVAEVKQVLVDQGLGFASAIPEINRTIPIVASDSFLLVRTVYQLAVAAGTWLPWVVLGMLVLGVAVARDRRRALAWAGAGLALSLLLLAAGLGIGRRFFVGTVSPSIMPAATADVLFEQVTAFISSTLLSLVVLGLAFAVGGWLTGPSRPAIAIRGAGNSAFTAVRGASDRHGLDTRGFGRAVDRWRAVIVGAAIAIGVLVLFLARPITVGGVIGTIVAVLAVLLVVELVRRPGAADDSDHRDEGANEAETAVS